MKNITITKQANAQAIGHRSNGNCKPIICITTGAIYASATDAAEKIGVSQSVLSMAAVGKIRTVKGKRYCYVQNVMQYLEEICENTRIREEKVAKYDKIVNTQRRKDALEERKAKLEAMKAKLAKEAAAIAAEEQALDEV